MKATFAERLKELRNKAGLSQPGLAEKAGMTKDGIAHLEQGRREPSWATVQALCKALGVSCEIFQDVAASGPAKVEKASGKAKGKAKKEKR